MKVLVNKFSHSRYEPSGITNNPEVRIAKSITDYIFRWLAIKFLAAGERGAAELTEVAEKDATLNSASPAKIAHKSSPAGISESEKREKNIFATQSDAPSCSECGSIMVRNGACFKCLNCGSTSGCS